MTTQEAQEYLWTDDAILAAYRQTFDVSPDVHHWALLCEMRDTYEQRLAAVTAESEARWLLADVHGRRMLKAEAERDELRRQLDELQQLWSGVREVDKYHAEMDGSEVDDATDHD